MSPVQQNSAAAAIADRIRAVRANINMTQEDFAELIDVTRSHLSHIETYRIEPSLRAILGVLVLDLRISGEPVRCIDPTWLLLGPEFEADMWGKMRHKLLFERPMEDRDLLAHNAQHGLGVQPGPDND